MNKFLLSLMLFGYFFTTKGQESEGGESIEDDSERESGTTETPKKRDPNYFIDRFEVSAGVTIAHPYPLDECVLTTLDSTQTVPYVLYQCANNGDLEKLLYSDAACAGNYSSRVVFKTADAPTSGDIESWYCDGETYSFDITFECNTLAASDRPSTKGVPGVCYRDSDDTVNTISNFYSCDGDTEDVTFNIYPGDSVCSTTPQTVDLPLLECSGTVLTSQVTGLNDSITVSISSVSGCFTETDTTDTTDSSGVIFGGSVSFIIAAICYMFQH